MILELVQKIELVNLHLSDIYREMLPKQEITTFKVIT
jgi:hypothetical protein